MNIDKLKELLNSNKLNLSCIKKEIEALKDLDNDHEIEYLKDLLDPINRKNVKIPSKNPVPTVTVQMKSYSDIKLDYGGETLVSICPYFLADNTYYNKNILYHIEDDTYEFHVKKLSTCCQFNIPPIYDENELIFNLNKIIEPGIYIKYRLVSAALKVIYTGSIGGACGTIEGGISLENDNKILCFGRIVEEAEPEDPHGQIVPSVYAYENDFVDSINKMIYHKENNCINGLTMIYFPVDNSYLEFCDIVRNDDIYWPGENIQSHYHGARPVLCCNDKCFKGNFRWLVHILNGPITQSNCFRFEMYCNFECIPSPKVLNYMPVSINTYFLNDNIILCIINKIKEYINENNI